MQTWVMQAFASMFFAGFTSVIAKKGLEGISGDLGLTIRTCFVFLFTVLFSVIAVPQKEWSLLKTPNWLWLAGSAVTTTLSWIFYYKAIKVGEVSSVALIDKGSVIVSVLLAFALLHEAVTPAKLMGAALIVGGLVIIARG
ncbi:MAG TPA: EamA family transporter [Drouetiella sp.]|jgi:bacterial/archaeal transporter family protein